MALPLSVYEYEIRCVGEQDETTDEPLGLWGNIEVTSLPVVTAIGTLSEHDLLLFSRTMSMDYTKPLIVPAGSDALGQIGECVACWRSVVCSLICTAGVPSLSAGDLAKINAKSVLPSWQS